MSRRMPVLGQHDVGESAGKAVDDGHDLIPARNREPAVGAKIFLHVDHEENIAVVGADRHGAPPDFARRRSTSAARRSSASATITGYGSARASPRNGLGSRSSWCATRLRPCANI